ncbi:RHOMBOID-like protein 8 [Asparagus officinalis]|nr:RHOMBOID-like protein 8 [Asparagus officinalis]
MLAGLIQNWKIYVAKFSALAMLGFVAIINCFIGLLPLADNFSSIGGFLSGILLGVVVLFNPQLSIMERKKGLFDYDLNKSVKLKQKLDKPIPRIIAFLMFVTILAGGLVAVIWGINANHYCSWCKYINCIPTEKWSCNERAPACEAMVSDGRLTLMCLFGDKFRTFPFDNISKERIDELCSITCS